MKIPAEQMHMCCGTREVVDLRLLLT